jgi:hypothetical protein
VSPVGVLGLTLLIYVVLARYGVDPMHDGIMLGAARLVGEGGVVHRDAFAMYGPLTTWIQALEYRIGGETLLSLRIGSSIALALAASLTYFSFRQLFGSVIAIISVSFWVLSAPFVLRIYDQIPWNSDYVLLFQSLAMFMLVRTRKFKVGNWAVENMLIVGALIAAITLSRISVGLVTTCFIFFDFGVRRKWKQLASLAIGYLFFWIFVLSILLIQGSLSEWWFQFVEFPRLRFLVKSGESGLESIKSALLILGIPTSGLLLMARLGVLHVTEYKNSSAFRAVASIATTSIVLLLVFLQGRESLWTPERIFWGLLVSAPLLLVFPPGSPSPSTEAILGPPGVMAVSVGALVQLFPQTDYRHLWWSVLPILGFLVRGLIPKSKSLIATLLATLILVFPVTVSAISDLRDRIESDYFALSNTPILDGMLVSPEFKAAFADQFDLINEFQAIHGPKTILNICVDGLFATLGIEMDYPDQNFVVWEDLNSANLDSTRVEYVRKKEPIIWYCPSAVSSPNVTNRPAVTEVLPVDYRLVRRSICLDGVGGFDDWPLMSYVGVPKSWPRIPLEDELINPSRCEGLGG